MNMFTLTFADTLTIIDTYILHIIYIYLYSHMKYVLNLHAKVTMLSLNTHRCLFFVISTNVYI